MHSGLYALIRVRTVAHGPKTTLRFAIISEHLHKNYIHQRFLILLAKIRLL